jgi:hypothetical protein
MGMALCTSKQMMTQQYKEQLPGGMRTCMQSTHSISQDYSVEISISKQEIHIFKITNGNEHLHKIINANAV